MASKMLHPILWRSESNPRKILIPDVLGVFALPEEDLVIAVIGVFCATVVIATGLFDFFGARVSLRC
jgi:hypothetical protein